MTHPPIRVGIIGVHPDRGWASTAHVPALWELPQYRLSALSHSRIEIARASAKKFGFDHAVSSTEELVHHPDVDLVVVTVRVPEHLQLVTAALEAGKSVFSEWPLGINLRDAQTMNALAAQKGVSAMIGLQTRANPTLRHMRKLIKQGFLGEVLSASVIGSGITWGGRDRRGIPVHAGPVQRREHAACAVRPHYRCLAVRARRGLPHRVGDVGQSPPNYKDD